MKQQHKISTWRTMPLEFTLALAPITLGSEWIKECGWELHPGFWLESIVLILTRMIRTCGFFDIILMQFATCFENFQARKISGPRCLLLLFIWYFCRCDFALLFPQRQPMYCRKRSTTWFIVFILSSIIFSRASFWGDQDRFIHFASVSEGSWNFHRKKKRLILPCLIMWIHIPSALVGSVCAGSGFLLIHRELSHRRRLTTRWELSEYAEERYREWKKSGQVQADAGKASLSGAATAPDLTKTWNKGVSSLRNMVSQKEQ